MKRLILAAALCLVLGTPLAAQTLNDDLKAIRARYPSPVVGTQMAEILNEAVWKHKSEGYVLLGKPGGNNCPQPKTGTLVSCDFIVDAATKMGWDVFSGAESSGDSFGFLGKNGPGTDLSSAIDSGARSLVPAVQPATEPDNPPPPPPPNDPPTSAEHDAIIGLLGEFQAQVNERMGVIQAAIDKLAATPPAPPINMNDKTWLRQWVFERFLPFLATAWVTYTATSKGGQ